MTATATLLARINGGSPQSGGITASAADVVQLVAQSYAGWGSPAPRWEILAYPLSWPTPSGWTLESSSGIIYYLGTTPPAFTLPSAGNVTAGMFGVWRFALTVNGGGSADLVDKGKTSIEIVSDNGVRDIAYGENKEFDPKFGYSSKMMGNNRLLDQNLATTVAIVPSAPALVTSGTGTPGTSAGVARADHAHQLTEGVLRAVATSLTAPLAVNSQRITNVALPVDQADAVPKLHIDSMTSKLFVRGASLGNQSLSGALTEDGITYQTGDLYLAKNQSTGSQNGVYVVNTAGAWARHTSMSLSAHLTNGGLVGVREGTANAGTGWVLTTAAPITLNTTSLVFAKVWMLNSGTVTNVTGIAPILVSNNTTTPEISISPAQAATMVTAAIRGSMSGEDKGKLDDATPSPTNGTLVLRDGTGGTSFNQVNVEGVRWTTEKDLGRSIPLDWSACKVGGVVSWSINDTSDIVNDVVDPFANLNIECDFPHGCKIKKVKIWNKGAGSGPDPLPATPPSFNLYRKPIATGIPALLATVNATLDGTYRGNWRETELDLSGSPHTVDAAANRYYIVITPEHGADSLAGCMVRAASVDRNFPANYVIGLE
jgi:hypothetical protein